MGVNRSFGLASLYIYILDARLRNHRQSLTFATFILWCSTEHQHVVLAGAVANATLNGIRMLDPGSQPINSDSQISNERDEALLPPKKSASLYYSMYAVIGAVAIFLLFACVIFKLTKRESDRVIRNIKTGSRKVEARGPASSQSGSKESTTVPQTNISNTSATSGGSTKPSREDVREQPSSASIGSSNLSQEGIGSSKLSQEDERNQVKKFNEQVNKLRTPEKKKTTTPGSMASMLI
ncbi:hypothetical protein Q1695_013115 [Nippostrongylus brasiliensis]|nr:hypothetical protein Q1695_013115 [Nippostrongylus brasiliensis]